MKKFRVLYISFSFLVILQAAHAELPSEFLNYALPISAESSSAIQRVSKEKHYDLMTILQNGGVGFKSGATVYLDYNRRVLYAYIDPPNAEMIAHILTEAMGKSQKDAYEFFSFENNSCF